MTNQDLQIDFSYVDEFGQATRLTKNLTDAILTDRTPFGFLVDEFKVFLLACGFVQETVDKLQIVE